MGMTSCYRDRVYRFGGALAQKTRVSKSWRAREEIFRTMPARSFAIFCLAVAFTFAAIGVVNDLFDLEHSDTAKLVGKIVSASSFAVVGCCWFTAEHYGLSSSSQCFR